MCAINVTVLGHVTRTCTLMSQCLQNGFHLEKESHGTKMFLLAECEDRDCCTKKLLIYHESRNIKKNCPSLAKNRLNVLYLVYESACQVSLHSHF